MLTSPLKIQRTLTCLRGQDPDSFVRSLIQPGHAFGLAMAPISLVGVLEAAIARMGRGCEVGLASWWLSAAQTTQLCDLVQAGYIGRVAVALDRGMRDRLKDATTELDQRLGSSVRWGETHAKAITVRHTATGECLTILTSQADPGVQAEWWLATSDPCVHLWLSAYLQGEARPDRLPQDVATALRIRQTPYARQKGRQDAQGALVAGVVKPPDRGISCGIIGGETLAPLGLVAGCAARMNRPKATLIGWWLSGKSATGIDLLERAGLVSSVRCVVSSVQDGVYNQSASDAMRAVLGNRVRYADNHAKLCLLEDGSSRQAILSTGNWQVDSPRAEIFWLTEDPAVCNLIGHYGAWCWGDS